MAQNLLSVFFKGAMSALRFWKMLQGYFIAVPYSTKVSLALHTTFLLSLYMAH
jgi:hypothetical protein